MLVSKMHCLFCASKMDSSHIRFEDEPRMQGLKK